MLALNHFISFPGLGIGEFEVNPTAFKVFGHPVMWYGILITVGMLCGFLTAYLLAKKKEHIKLDDLLDLAIFTIIFAMIGSRLYYVIMEFDSYRGATLWETFKNVIAVWNGGLAIYGGVIAGAATVFVVAKVKKIKPAKLFDLVAPAVIIGQVIGRWGNFINGEAHGGITENFLRMGICTGSEVVKYYHPTFLYESLWNLIGFVILLLLYRKKKFDGQIALSYLIWYGFGRFFIEGLRTDSLYLFKSAWGETVRVSQVVAAICVIGGIIWYILLARRAKDKAMDAADYDAVYAAADPHAHEEEASTLFTVKPAEEKAESESSESEKQTEETAKETDNG